MIIKSGFLVFDKRFLSNRTIIWMQNKKGKTKIWD